MIQIDDNDLPITVAEKIIKGTKPNKYSTDGWKHSPKMLPELSAIQLICSA